MRCPRRGIVGLALTEAELLEEEEGAAEEDEEEEEVET